MAFEHLDLVGSMGHEQVVLCAEPAAGYRAVIAVHSTRLGPGVGGTRVWLYGSERAAIVDALRLSRSMTYKCAAAGLPLGGGKSVIILDGDAPAGEARERVFLAHGRAVERLGGRYVAAEDVGSSPADMAIVRRVTTHVAGLPSGHVDPSPDTARGVFRAVQAAARHRWGTDDLGRRTVAVQGCGNVGSHLARALHRAGARLVVSDVRPERARRVAAETGARVVAPERIVDEPADVFSPCALGGAIDDATLPRLRAEIVAGAANNVLLEPRHGDALAARGVLYAPDYVANAGGVIGGTRDLLGWSDERARAGIEAIYETLLEIFARAASLEVAPHRAADLLAEERLASGVS